MTNTEKLLSALANMNGPYNNCSSLNTLELWEPECMIAVDGIPRTYEYLTDICEDAYVFSDTIEVCDKILLKCIIARP